jgi:thiosulfate/3-mercaptopyruvate sulfurtransferase
MSVAAEEPNPMNTLASVAQLSALVDAAGGLVFDCRFSLADPAAGRRAYEQAHVPGAYFAEMNRDLSTPHIPGKTGRHPLPAKADWIAQVKHWGISPDIQVVLYDDNGGASAARMWWMLQWIGHGNVAVLDGGWQAWTNAGKPVTAEVPAPRAPSTFDYSTVRSPAALLDAAAIDGNKQLLLDARDPPRFRGEVEPIDPVAGHIPGAICSPLSANLAAGGTFKGAEELRAKFSAAASPGKQVVCYCGSGITACHNILAMAIAGLPMPALYAGSWSEWITNPARPVAKGN